jgi:hypothetical protein
VQVAKLGRLSERISNAQTATSFTPRTEHSSNAPCQDRECAYQQARRIRLTLLAPDIVSAILSGKQPPDLTARKLLNDVRLPPDWNEQRRSLGFA